VLAGQRVERAVGEQDLVVLDARLVALVGERLGQKRPVAVGPSRGLLGLLGGRGSAHPAPFGEGRVVEGGLDLEAVGRGAFHAAGQDVADQVVAPGGQRDGPLSVGAAVELRGPTGSRAAAAGEPTELDVEEPVLDEALEVELGRVHGHADPCGGLFPSHGVLLRDDELVELAADRLGERGDAGCLIGKVHDGAPFLKNETLDVTTRPLLKSRLLSLRERESP
jgi:hypothetical protein